MFCSHAHCNGQDAQTKTAKVILYLCKKYDFCCCYFSCFSPFGSLVSAFMDVLAVQPIVYSSIEHDPHQEDFHRQHHRIFDSA